MRRARERWRGVRGCDGRREWPAALARGTIAACAVRFARGSVQSASKIAHQTGGGPPLADFDNFRYLTSLGDLNGDGVTDLAVGAPDDDSGGDRRGAVHILFLRGPETPNVTLSSNTTTIEGQPVIWLYDTQGDKSANWYSSWDRAIEGARSAGVGPARRDGTPRSRGGRLL